MTNEFDLVLIKVKTKKPKNCRIKIEDMFAFYRITVNKNDMDMLNEKDKKKVYQYLQEIQEKINKTEKMPLVVYENFND